MPAGRGPPKHQAAVQRFAAPPLDYSQRAGLPREARWFRANGTAELAYEPAVPRDALRGPDAEVDIFAGFNLQDVVVAQPEPALDTQRDLVHKAADCAPCVTPTTRERSSGHYVNYHYTLAPFQGATAVCYRKMLSSEYTSRCVSGQPASTNVSRMSRNPARQSALSMKITRNSAKYRSTIVTISFTAKLSY